MKEVEKRMTVNFNVNYICIQKADALKEVFDDMEFKQRKQYDEYSISFFSDEGYCLDILQLYKLSLFFTVELYGGEIEIS